jgi:hypothetical protein
MSVLKSSMSALHVDGGGGAVGGVSLGSPGAGSTAGGGGSGGGGGLAEKDAVRPLDIAYLARLAMYENFHSSEGNSLHAQRANSLGSSLHAPLAHTRASDEEMWLLIAGVHIVTPAMPTSTSADAAPATSSTNSATTHSPSSGSAKKMTEEIK